MGGKLPVLDVNPKELQNVLNQLSYMMNISGVSEQDSLLTDLLLFRQWICSSLQFSLLNFFAGSKCQINNQKYRIVFT